MRMKAKLSVVAAAGVMMLAGSPVLAQDDDGYRYAAYGPDNETVHVTVPRYHPQRSPLGAPYRLVSMSKGVYIGDLDLRTRRDVRVLRDRISYTARTLCHRLNAMYPVTAPNSPGCYTTAMDDAMYQADIAIARARGEY